MWEGVISVAIYMENAEFYAKNKQRVVDAWKRVEEKGKCRLDVSLLLENTEHKNLMYPINALR